MAATRLLPPQDYADRLVGAVHRLPSTPIAIGDAHRRVLAEDVTARYSLPGFDNSAMDGYVVRAADVPAPGTTLPVAGVIAAGDTRQVRLEPGTAWQIMTGAAVPDGADAIVQVEHTDGGTEQVRFDVAAVAGRSIRAAGGDVQAGALVLPAGTRIGARHVPVLAASGRAEVPVVPLPKVALISTGDELRSPGEELEHGQIIDTNGPMLAALVRQAGFEVARVDRCGDTGDAVRDAVDAALAAGADAIITSGGVSAGAFEPLKAAFEGGTEVEFSKIAMQPGKPQGFGFVRTGVPLFALPGNPVSSLVSFVVFVAPALRVMAGRSPQIRWTTATVADGWRTPDERTQLARVRLEHRGDGHFATASGGPGSHLMGGLSTADGLAWIDAEIDEVRAGDRIRVIGLDGEFV